LGKLKPRGKLMIAVDEYELKNVLRSFKGTSFNPEKITSRPLRANEINRTYWTKSFSKQSREKVTIYQVIAEK
jgi:hypothetical protein